MSVLPLRIITSSINDDYNTLIQSTLSLSPLKSTTRSSIIPPPKPNKTTSSSSSSSSSSLNDIEISEEDKIIQKYYKQKIDPQQSFLQDKSFHKVLNTIELIKKLSIHSSNIFQSLYDDVNTINNKIITLSNDCIRVSKLCNELDSIPLVYDSNCYNNIRNSKHHGINTNSNETTTNQLLPSSIPLCIKEKYMSITYLTNFDVIDDILNIERGTSSKKRSDPQSFFRTWKTKQENKIKLIQNSIKDNKNNKKKKKVTKPKRTSRLMSIFRSMTETNKTDIKIDNIEKILQTESYFKVNTIVVPEKSLPQTPPPKAKRPMLHSYTNPSSPVPSTNQSIPSTPPPPPPPPPLTSKDKLAASPIPPPPPPPAYPNPNKVTQNSQAPPLKPPRRQSSDGEVTPRKDSIDSDTSLRKKSIEITPRKDSIDSDTSLRKQSIDDDEHKVSTEVDNVVQKSIKSKEVVTVRQSFEIDETVETRISIPISLLDSIKSNRILTEGNTLPVSPKKDKMKMNFNKEDIFEQIRRGSMLKKVDTNSNKENGKRSSLGLFDSTVVAELLARRSYLEQDQSDEDDDDDWD